MIQEKESKSKTHFYFSMVKSAIRIAAGFILIKGDLTWAGILLIIAEVLGIAEETI